MKNNEPIYDKNYSYIIKNYGYDTIPDYKYFYTPELQEKVYNNYNVIKYGQEYAKSPTILNRPSGAMVCYVVFLIIGLVYRLF